jgi:hypothetical protein
MEKALIRTGQKSNKIFVVPTGETVPATEKALLQHELRGGAREVDMCQESKTTSSLAQAKW